MDEYIKREALLCMVKPDDPSDEKAAITIATAKKLIRSFVSRVPAADVAPVRHGWWIYDHWCEFRCSVCGEFSNSKPYRGKENYCPNCGAKMDGGQNNEVY